MPEGIREYLSDIYIHSTSTTVSNIANNIIEQTPDKSPPSKSTVKSINIRSSSCLNTTWQKIFSWALCTFSPSPKKREATTIQFLMRERSVLLQPTMNEPVGTPMSVIYSNLQIWSINANIVILRVGLLKIHKLCQKIQHFIHIFQEVNLDLLDCSIRRFIQELFNQNFVNKIFCYNTNTNANTLETWRYHDSCCK